MRVVVVVRQQRVQAVTDRLMEVWAVMAAAVVEIRLEEILLFHQRQGLLIRAAEAETEAQEAQA